MIGYVSVCGQSPYSISCRARHVSMITTLSPSSLYITTLPSPSSISSLLNSPSLMDITWDNPKSSSSSSTHHHYRHPSFSSSLLDQIYRSIDQDHDSTTTTKRQDREVSPAKHRRSVAADFERLRRRTITTDSVLLRYSNSSSSDSSGFSSSESESFYKHSRHHQPKPIRTSVDCKEVQKPNKQEVTGFLRTKSKALKIYTDLKKVKQPISPGGRLATFLNSLLPTNPKKPKKSNTTAPEQQRSPAISSTTCSAASSFSRSCLSKTPSSSGKSKRSVRFCPVNVILDDEYSSIRMPHGYSNRLYGDNKEAKRDREEENRRVIEAAKDLLRTYQKKNKDHDVNVEDDDDDEEDDDALSCASSDLFELENLSAIGIERYREELPVYETTRLDKTNRAIAT